MSIPDTVSDVKLVMMRTNELIGTVISIDPDDLESPSDLQDHFDMRIVDHINLGIYFHKAISSYFPPESEQSIRHGKEEAFWRDYLEKLEREVRSERTSAVDSG